MHIPYLGEFFEFISKTSFYGLPLDIPAHIIVGGLIAYLFLKVSDNYKICLTLIFAIALTKELFDQRIMTNTLTENFKDIFFTMAPPILIIHLHQIKTKTTISLR